MVDGCMPYESLSPWKLKDAKLFGVKTYDLKNHVTFLAHTEILGEIICMYAFLQHLPMITTVHVHYYNKKICLVGEHLL